MKIRKSLAGIAAGSLALTGLAVAIAPAANAGSSVVVTTDIKGDPINNIQTDLAWGTTADNITISATYGGVGTNANTSKLNVSIQLSEGPDNGPAVALTAGTYQLEFDVSLDGTPVLTGNQLQTAAGTVDVDVSQPTFVGGVTVNAVIDNVANGAHVVRLDKIVNNTGDLTTRTTFDTEYTDHSAGQGVGALRGGPIGSASQVTPLAAAKATATQNIGNDGIANNGDDSTIWVEADGGNAPVRNGDLISLTSANTSWANTGNPTLTICTGQGTGCAPAFTNSMTAITAMTANGTGGLTTGQYRVAAGSFSGLNYVQITQGSNVAYVTINILGGRTLVAGQGNPSLVNGSNWYPGENVTLTSPGAAGSPTVVQAGTNGALPQTAFDWTGSTTSVLTATGTIGPDVAVVNGSSTTQSRILTAALVDLIDNCFKVNGATVNALCRTDQKATATINGGVLKQVASPAAGNSGPTQINLGSLTTPTVATPLNGAFNPIQVTDTRGVAAGWSLTAALADDFKTTSGSTILKSAFEFTSIGCATDAAAPASSAPVPGTAGGLGTARQLCRVNDSTNAAVAVGGLYNVTGGVRLTVPAFQSAGVYTATLQVTLA